MPLPTLDPTLHLGELDLRAAPALSSSPPALHPDLGPGEGQARDAGLDAAAVATTNIIPLAEAGETEGEARAADDLDASVAAARAVQNEQEEAGAAERHGPRR